VLRERPLRPIRALGPLLALALAALALLAAPASAQSGSLTTLFSGINGFAGNTFDLEVLPPDGVVIDSLDVNVEPKTNNGTIEVWTRPDTAVGFEASLDGWTSQGSVEVTAAGLDNPTPVPISFSLAQGTYGVAVGVDFPSLTMRYTSTVDPQIFNNDVLKLTSGQGLGSPPLESIPFGPRIWNGTIHYTQPSQECRELKADQKKAKRKYRKAKRKARKRKKAYKKAKSSGDQQKIKKAKRKAKKAKKKARKRKRKYKKAKKAYRKACK
jgi:hypothetical protein